MRSTTRRRLTMCSCCALATAHCSLPDTFAAWRLTKRFVVGERLSSRSELRANARALRYLVSRPDTPEIHFLSGELQPVALAPGDNRYQVSE